MTEKIYNFFQKVDNEILNITKIRCMCSIKGKRIKNIPIEINEDKNKAILYLPNTPKLTHSIQCLKKNEFDIIVDTDYMYRHVFVIKVETKFPENIICLTVGLNGYTYKKKTKVNMAIVDLNSAIDLSRCIVTAPGCVEFLLDSYKFRITIGDKNLYLYSYKKLQETDFLKYLQAIKLALGFITGVFIGGKSCVFSTKSFLGKFLKINYLKNLSMTSEKKLSIDTFIANYYPLKEELKKYDSHGKIQLTDMQFGKLCELVFKDDHISTTLHYLSQSELAGQNLEHQLVLLACAYEALTRYCRNQNEETLLPEDIYNIFEHEIKDKIKENIEQFDVDNKKNIIETLQGKINNYISNTSKLMKPLTENGLLLSKDEKRLLNHRNKMFHGEPFSYTEDIDFNIHEFQKEKYLYYFLIYAIILKRIGYDGYIIDARRWNEIIKYSHDANTFPYQDNFIYNLGNTETTELESE